MPQGASPTPHARMQTRLRGHRVQAARLTLSLGAIFALGQSQKSECAGSETRGRGGLAPAVTLIGFDTTLANISARSGHSFLLLRSAPITPPLSSKWSVRAGMTCSRRFAGGRPSSRLALGIVCFYFKSCRSDVTYGTVLHMNFLLAAPPWSVEDIGAAFVVRDHSG
jgi:hypothetical protein